MIFFGQGGFKARTKYNHYGLIFPVIFCKINLKMIETEPRIEIHHLPTEIKPSFGSTVATMYDPTSLIEVSIDGQKVGILWLDILPEHAMIRRIETDTESTAEALVAATEQFLARKGITRVTTTLGREDASLEKILRKHGWNKVGSPQIDLDSPLTMYKTITPGENVMLKDKPVEEISIPMHPESISKHPTLAKLLSRYPHAQIAMLRARLDSKYTLSVSLEGQPWELQERKFQPSWEFVFAKNQLVGAFYRSAGQVEGNRLHIDEPDKIFPELNNLIHEINKGVSLRRIFSHAHDSLPSPSHRWYTDR